MQGKGVDRCGGICQYKGMLVGAQKVLMDTRRGDDRHKGQVLIHARGYCLVEWRVDQHKRR